MYKLFSILLLVKGIYVVYNMRGIPYNGVSSFIRYLEIKNNELLLDILIFFYYLLSKNLDILFKIYLFI